MGLNLASLSALVIKNETPSPTKPEAIHNAPSQSNEKPNATSILESLATSVSNSQKAPSPEAITKLDQSRSLPANEPRTIKYQEISDNITSLREAIHGAHPKMPNLLQEIWKTLHSYPEQVALLEEDQMEIIIAGLEKVVDVDLANITLKSATSGKKGKAAISSASLGF